MYKIVNFLHNLSEEERKEITSLPKNVASLSPKEREFKGEFLPREEIPETLEQAVQKEKAILLKIQGMKEVVELTDADRRYIFEHEEERNHGVYECLRRQVLFAVTHDSTLRQPDEAIVMQAGEKVVFPVIDFYEIQRKKVSSSSPGLKIHEYLVPKFQNV